MLKSNSIDNSVARFAGFKKGELYKTDGSRVIILCTKDSNVGSSLIGVAVADPDGYDKVGNYSESWNSNFRPWYGRIEMVSKVE